jgi:hypothetical protein
MLLAPAGALATPVHYGLDAGQLNLQLFQNGALISRAEGVLSAGDVVFDPSNGQINGLSLSGAGLALASALPGAYNALDFSVSIVSGAGFVSSGAATQPYLLELGPLDAALSGFLVDLNPPVTVQPLPVESEVSTDLVTGIAYVTDEGGLRLVLRSVRLGELRFGDDVFELRADVKFWGSPVPEPALALLLAASVVGLGLARRS